MTGQPSLWDQTGGKVGHDHPQPSHTAARQVKSGSQKAQILIALYGVWPGGGFTGYALAETVVNASGRPISSNQTCTRLLELREDGLVEFVREFPGGPVIEAETTPGNTAQVHRLTKLGYQSATGLLSESNRGVADYGEYTTSKKFRMNPRRPATPPPTGR